MPKFLILLFSISLFISCGSDEEEVLGDLANCTYLKARKGTTFLNSINGTDYETTVVGTQFVDGRDFVVVTNQNGDGSFISCEGDKFIVTAVELTTEGTSTTIRNVRLDFNLDAPVGVDILELTIVNRSTTLAEIIESTILYIGKVVNTGLTKTVNNIAYNDVVEYHIRTENELDDGTTVETTNTIYFFAPEVGPILTESFNSTNGVLNFRSELLNYTY